MLYKECKRACQHNLARFVFVVFGLVVGSGPATAQQITTLIQFTNVWKYDQSGLELGTAWRTNDYDDSNWPSGAGLLGFDTTPAVWTVHAPIVTPLVISATVTSYYFRTTFQFSGTTNGLSLLASNLVDDGCVIYLNGLEAGRLRVVQNQNATTLATGGTEGQLEVLNLGNVTRLLQGTNLLAVEVHQSSITGVDVMWGMKLMAIQQLPLAITNQPQDRIAIVGEDVTFEVGVEGGPVNYQWQKNGVNISGATGKSYTVANAQLTSAGEYRVVVSNDISMATSGPGVLSVFPDTTGPRLLSAVVRETGTTNQILLTFSETVQSGLVANSSSTNVQNYRITRCGGTDDVVVTNATAGGRQVQLRVSGPNWVIDDCYYVTVNNVTDSRANRIAPNSQVAVSWPVHVNLLDTDAPWNFHASAIFDAGVFDENWTATNYVESFWWAQGSGVFYGGPPPASSCFGPLQTSAGFQPEPILFRTTFQWPAHFGTNAVLRPRFAVDDGMVLYLNGAEIWRYNMATQAGAMTTNTRAAVVVTTASCVTNTSITVTNLMPGQNWLAAAVVQATSGNADMIFGLALGASTSVSDPLPEVPVPTLNLAPEGAGAVRLWWTGGGYALESATNLTDNAASYPQGPWQEVPSMSNPYTNSLSNPTRFFRLKK